MGLARAFATGHDASAPPVSERRPARHGAVRAPLRLEVGGFRGPPPRHRVFAPAPSVRAGPMGVTKRHVLGCFSAIVGALTIGTAVCSLTRARAVPQLSLLSTPPRAHLRAPPRLEKTIYDANPVGKADALTRDENSFRARDSDGDGFLSPDEMLDVHRAFVMPMDTQKQLFTQMDKDGDGQISLNEFYYTAEDLNHFGSDPRARLESAQVFVEYDENEDGKLDIAELTAWDLDNMMPDQAEEEAAIRAADGLNAMDSDHNGSVDLEEWIQGAR